LNVTGVDVDPTELSRNRNLASVCAESHSLPLAGRSFDFVVCHHSLEHFSDAAGVIREIRRVLKTQGRLFVSVPDGGSFSDRLYRLLFCGGGHVQRFSFASAVGAIEAGTGLRLAGSQELFTSFIFVDKRNFVPAPRGRQPGPFPRRMRWLGRLPSWSFSFARLSLNLGSRLADYCFSTGFSRYGWALVFDAGARRPAPETPEEEPGDWNVCMSCGSALEGAIVRRVAGLLYRCPYCSSLNCFFGSTPAAAR
jgi:SAM-dependent methyltransferase